MLRISLVVVALASVACTKPAAEIKPAEDHHAEEEEHHAKASVDRETVDTDGVVRRGTPLTPDLETVPVSLAVAKAKDYDGKKIKLAGKVESVCARMGCWFVVQGEKPEDKIRISTKAHNIFVPKSSVGMMATVEGTFTVKTLPKETAEGDRATLRG
jgi:hypothetical protein